MGIKAHRQARAKALKSEEARRREVEMIRSQLDDLGLPEADVRGVHAALDEFARDGVGQTRTWKMQGFGVGITLLLSTQPHITSYAKLSRC